MSHPPGTDPSPTKGNLHTEAQLNSNFLDWFEFVNLNCAVPRHRLGGGGVVVSGSHRLGGGGVGVSGSDRLGGGGVGVSGSHRLGRVGWGWVGVSGKPWIHPRRECPALGASSCVAQTKLMMCGAHRVVSEI